jgi:hypothetical protein
MYASNCGIIVKGEVESKWQEAVSTLGAVKAAITDKLHK